MVNYVNINVEDRNSNNDTWYLTYLLQDSVMLNIVFDELGLLNTALQAW